MTETEEAAPTCYRHSDRETYVRCTRCDRSICPDCMSAAAVGFQCPECVREGNRTIRQARTVFGGRVGADANVTKVIIGVCVVAFVAQLAGEEFTDEYAMAPASVAARGEYYRMLTSAFLHVPTFLLHIGFNMYALLAFGSQVERLLGAARYVILYLVSALGGSVATLWFMDPVVLNAEGLAYEATSIGASGAVFGLFGAYFVMARKLRADTSQLLVLIGINLAIGYVGRGYINNWAHLGGLATGAAVAYAFAHAPRGPRQALLQYGGAALVLAALAAATVVRSAELRQEPLVRRITSTMSGTGAPSR